MASRSQREREEVANLDARVKVDRAHNVQANRQFITSYVPSVGSVALTSDTGLLVVATLDGKAQRVSFDAGWEEIDRPGNKKALDHNESPLEGWTIPVLFDGFATRTRQETAIETLYKLGAKVSRTDFPPKVRVAGIGPISSRQDWVVATIDASGGDEALTQWGRDRNRIRARFDVTITERVLPQLVKIKPAKATRDRSGAHGKRTALVRSGDTLQRVALRELGDASRWRELARKNRIRDPARPPVGRHIKLP